MYIKREKRYNFEHSLNYLKDLYSVCEVENSKPGIVLTAVILLQLNFGLLFFKDFLLCCHFGITYFCIQKACMQKNISTGFVRFCYTNTWENDTIAFLKE